MKCLAIGGEPATGKTTLVKWMYDKILELTLSMVY